MTKQERTQIAALQRDVAELRLDMRWMKKILTWGLASLAILIAAVGVLA